MFTISIYPCAARILSLSRTVTRTLAPPPISFSDITRLHIIPISLETCLEG